MARAGAAASVVRAGARVTVAAGRLVGHRFAGGRLVGGRWRAVGWSVAALVYVGGCALLLWVLIGASGGSRRMIDLEVYRAGASALLHGRDVYTAHPPGSHLPFTYPPLAAAFFVPAVLLGLPAAQIAVTSASLLALLLSLRLCLRAVRPVWTPKVGWGVAGVLGAAALFVDPVRSTLAFGQVNLLLMALVLVDLLAVRTYLPRGVLIGLAAALKLTPGIFVVYLALTRRVRAAATATAVVAASVALGFLVAPGPSLDYWTRLVFEPRRVGGVAFVGNQSLHGAAVRLAGGVDAVPAGAVLVVAVVAVVGLVGAAAAERRGAPLLGLGLCGVTGLLVSPISWNHHWVWALPIAVVLWARCAQSRSPGRIGAVVGWSAVFVLAPIWWVPNHHELEYTHHGLQLLAGNSYVLAGLALLACAPVLVGQVLRPRSGPPAADGGAASDGRSAVLPG